MSLPTVLRVVPTIFSCLMNVCRWIVEFRPTRATVPMRHELAMLREADRVIATRSRRCDGDAVGEPPFSIADDRPKPEGSGAAGNVADQRLAIVVRRPG